MAVTADTHMHSHFSGDSEAPMESMVLSAVQKGLRRICFTEHLDIDYKSPDGSDDGIFDLNIDSYLYELLDLRAKYKNAIDILFGIEIGVQPHLRRELALTGKSREFDFILHSTHMVGGIDPYYKEFFEANDPAHAMERYFEEVRKNLKTFDNFDSLAHLDYCCRYLPAGPDYDYSLVSDMADDILSFLIEHEKALELNTGGLGKSGGVMNPRSEILKRYRELGGELVTIGADAHRPEDIALGFDQACELLKSLGFKYYHVYQNRIPEAFRL